MGAAAGEQRAGVAEDKIHGTRPLPTTEMPVPTNMVGLKEREPKVWNTSNLGRRMGMDAMSAGVAGGLVAPVICAIDKYGHCSLGLSPEIRC